MDAQIDEMDRISNLPDFVSHRILSFLPRKDAARTCVLSKRWNSLWCSFPIFEFNQCRYIKGGVSYKPEHMEKVGDFMNHVDKSLQKFIQTKLRMEKLCLSMPLVDHKLVSLVDRWMLLALNNGVQEISLKVGTNLRGLTQNYYTFPETIFVVNSVDDCSTFYRLQKLSLKWVRISSKIIQDIIHCCPNIRCFSLESCCGLKTLKISKLDKLESVTVVVPMELGSISIDAPNLIYFSFRSLGLSALPCTISLTSCHDLKDLHLITCGITDELLNLYLSRFLFLENLEIDYAPMLRRVRISAQQLKSLCVERCDNMESIQIDAPSLSLLKFRTRTMPDFVSENVSCPMEIHYELSASQGQIDSAWFLKLRRFLGQSPQRKYLTIHCYENEECLVCFDIEELRSVAIPALVKIDHLEITCLAIEKSMNCEAFIDGMLWSCHPMTVSVSPRSMFENNCIKILCEKLLDKEQPSCCNASHLKCWRHDLKAVKIVSFGGLEDERLLHLNLLLDALPSLTKYQEVRISFEWEF